MSTSSNVLAQTELFRDSPPFLIELIQARAEYYDLAPGELLLSPQRENRHIYLLAQGSLGLHFNSVDSPEVKVFEPGVSIGEMSVIDRRQPSAFVVAREASRVFRIHGDILLELIADANPVVRNLIGILTDWIRANTESMVRDLLRIAELSNDSMTDQLTGLYNRRWLDNALERFTTKARDSREPLCLLMIDVDYFKNYNDRHGHLVGDQALMSLGNVLKFGARPLDFAARFGGEEFLVLLPDSSLRVGAKVAERIRVAVESLAIKSPEGKALPSITVSIGLVVSTVDSTPSSLVAAADAQLYLAKQAGRNCVKY